MRIFDAFLNSWVSSGVTPSLEQAGRNTTQIGRIVAVSEGTRRCVLFAAALTAAVAGVLVSTGSAEADDTVNLKLSLWVPPAHPLVPAVQAWAADIEKESGGTIKSTLFHSQQLGKAFDHYDMARDGIADVVFVNPGYQPGRFPIIAAGELPFMIADGRGGSKALDEWYRSYAGTEMGDTHFCLAFVHEPGSFHSKKKIVLPSDVSGLKVRPGNQTMAEFVTELGGANVKASAPEAREVLERGVADTITFAWESIFLFGIDQAVKYHIDAPIYTTTFVWTMNKNTYETMSDAQKKVIDNHCTTEWAEKMAGPWADWERAGIAKMKATERHEVYPLTETQLAAWREAAKPLVDKWAEGVQKAGINPDKALADFQVALDKYGASY